MIARIAALSAGAVMLAGCADSIHDIAGRGNLEAVRSMLADNPGLVNAPGHKGKTPLHCAVHYQRRDIMEFLVERGADLDAADITGMTPLHEAAARGFREEAAWLLDQGAVLEPRDTFGDTPVHTAAAYGQGAVLELLIARGADIRARNKQRLTPLEVARKYRHDRGVRYLETRLAKQGAG